MAIYITGDIHCPIDIHKLTSKCFSDKDMTKDDYLIIAGDTALVWDGAGHDKFWQDWFECKNFTTLFVDGNHDNHPMLNEYPVSEWHGGKVHFIRPSLIHLMRGQVFDITGKTFLTLGGAKSHDKECRIEGLDWWAEEEFTEEDYNETANNIGKYGFKVDYVISHDCPTHVVKEINPCYRANQHTHYLEQIWQQIEYKKWYFGHHHMDLLLPDGMRCLYNDIIEVR